jgi:hypothetical protein
MTTSEKRFPPVPMWRPSFAMPLEDIVERIRFYTNSTRDFVVFAHGTCAVVGAGLSDSAAGSEALAALSKVFNYHPDMNPTPMKDGNVLVRYNEPCLNVVLEAVVKVHWPEIESRHLDGLAQDEVLMTPLGANKFDDFGKKALLGRAYMFMDAQDPQAKWVVRAS